MCNSILISVIIPTYNRQNHITTAIDSVLSQSLSAYEIIVIDDGSIDNTGNILKKYKNKITHIYQPNAGPASARNRGIIESSGEWLAFLDSDDKWKPNKLEMQMYESIRLNADVSFHDLILYQTETNYYESWNKRVNHEFKKMPLQTGLLNDAYELMMMFGHLFLTTTLMVKKSVLLNHGLFREDLRTSEDLELYFRLAVDAKIAYVAEPLAIYNPGPVRITDKEKIYNDRIRAILISLNNCIKYGDYIDAEIAKKGLLQHIRSLAGVYRMNKRWYSSIDEYVRYMKVFATPVEKIPKVMDHLQEKGHMFKD